MDLTVLKLITMWRETGRRPSSVMDLTPQEFRFLFVRSISNREYEDRMLMTARGHIRYNPSRALAGMLPKIVDQLRLRIEGRL